jgi:hypothetical protein
MLPAALGMPHRRQVEWPLPEREPCHGGEELGCARAVAERVRHPHPERDGATRESRGLERDHRAIRAAAAIAVPRREAVEQHRGRVVGVEVDYRRIERRKDEGLLGLVSHRKLMVGECNIKGGSPHPSG